MKVLPPMSSMHFDAILKLVNAGAQAVGIQAHVEIHLAGTVLSAVQEIPDSEEAPKPADAATPASKPQQSRGLQRKRRKG